MSIHTFEVIANLPDETGLNTKPYAVRRLSDRKIFQVGNLAGDETGNSGFIHHIEYEEQTLEPRFFFSKTDPKGVLLRDAVYFIHLPFRFINGDHTTFLDIPVEIKGVHGYAGKTKYDLELSLPDGKKTRVYNVDYDTLKLVKGDQQ